MDYASTAEQSSPDLGRRVVRCVKLYLDALVNDLAVLSSGSYQWQLMMIVGSGVEIYRIGKGKAERLATLNERFDDKALTDLKRRLTGIAGQRMGLRFSPDRAVTRVISLPTSARDVTTEIVRNKVETLAPWPLTEALWGFRQVADHSGSDQIRLEVGIVGRHTVEELLRSLAKIGIKIDHLDIGDSTSAEDSIELDFRSERRTERIGKAVRAVMLSMGLATAIFAGLGGYLAASSFTELKSVEAQAARLSDALSNSSDAGKATKVSEARKLIERKRAEQPVITVLDALTRSIPDAAWLESIEYDDRQVTVLGRGTSIPPIVQALEGSAVFSSVNIAAATQRDPDANVDTFSISASVEPQRAANGE